MRIVLLLFIGLPIIEMIVLIKVGGLIGTIPTILLVLLTAVLGAALLKRQGASTWLRAQRKMQQGQMPASEMAEGLVLAVGGALLLTPGFVTDAIGFACLFPGLRHLMARFVVNKMLINMTKAQHNSSPQSDDEFQSNPQQPKPHRPRSGDTIDGEYRRED